MTHPDDNHEIQPPSDPDDELDDETRAFLAGLSEDDVRAVRAALAETDGDMATAFDDAPDDEIGGLA